MENSIRSDKHITGECILMILCRILLLFVYMTMLHGFKLHFLGQNSMKRFVGSVSRKAMGNRAHLGYVDSHCHLFARQFKGRIPEILKLGRDVGLEYAIINGLEPKTNRITLDMCSRYPEYLPAIGIYPLEACCNAINEDNWKTDMRPPQKFDVDAEVDFIDEMCAQKKIIAIGKFLFNSELWVNIVQVKLVLMRTMLITLIL